MLLFSGRGGSQSGKHIEHSAGATRPGTNSGASVGGAGARRSCTTTATAHARAHRSCTTTATATAHARAHRSCTATTTAHARARRSCTATTTATTHARASACCAAGHGRATLRSLPQVWVAQPGEPYLLWQQPVPGHAVFGQSFLLELRHPDPGQCQILPCLRA